MEKLKRALEITNGNIGWMITEFEIEQEILDEGRWNLEVYSILEIEGDYYGIGWSRAKTEMGEDYAPESLDEFDKLTRVEKVEVKSEVKYVTDYTGKLKVEELAPVLDMNVINQLVQEIGDPQYKLDQLEDLIRELMPLGKAVGFDNHHVAFNEYIGNLRKLIEISNQ